MYSYYLQRNILKFYELIALRLLWNTVPFSKMDVRWVTHINVTCTIQSSATRCDWLGFNPQPLLYAPVEPERGRSHKYCDLMLKFIDSATPFGFCATIGNYFWVCITVKILTGRLHWRCFVIGHLQHSRFWIGWSFPLKKSTGSFKRKRQVSLGLVSQMDVRRQVGSLPCLGKRTFEHPIQNLGCGFHSLKSPEQTRCMHTGLVWLYANMHSLSVSLCI